MASIKRFGTPAAKKAASKKTVAKKAVAKVLPVARATEVVPVGARRGSPVAQAMLSIGDVVMLNNSDGSVLGPGRLCDVRAATDSACVNFADGIGCMPVTLSRLSRAPSGSKAPPCDGCESC